MSGSGSPVRDGACGRWSGVPDVVKGSTNVRTPLRGIGRGVQAHGVAVLSHSNAKNVVKLCKSQSHGGPGETSKGPRGLAKSSGEVASAELAESDREGGRGGMDGETPGSFGVGAGEGSRAVGKRQVR